MGFPWFGFTYIPRIAHFFNHPVYIIAVKFPMWPRAYWASMATKGHVMHENSEILSIAQNRFLRWALKFKLDMLLILACSLYCCPILGFFCRCMSCGPLHTLSPYMWADKPRCDTIVIFLSRCMWAWALRPDGGKKLWTQTQQESNYHHTSGTRFLNFNYLHKYVQYHRHCLL